MTKDNRFLITGTENGTVIANLLTGSRLKISLYYRNDNSNLFPDEYEYIISDSTGRFECTDGVKNRIAVIENGTAKTDFLWNKYSTKNLVWKFMNEK